MLITGQSPFEKEDDDMDELYYDLPGQHFVDELETRKGVHPDENGVIGEVQDSEGNKYCVVLLPKDEFYQALEEAEWYDDEDDGDFELQVIDPDNEEDEE